MSETQDHLWFTRRYGQVRGPFPQRQISRYILLGRIREDDELSIDRENWSAVQALPHLIPDVMKNIQTEEDRQRLRLARQQADERGSANPRLGSERMQPDTGERRRASDLDPASGAEKPPHMKSRPGGVRNVDGTTRIGSCGPQCLVVSGVVVLLAILAVVFTPDAPPGSADCNAAAAPLVNWSNCRMPGLAAEQADLHGAQARNMDLTGAHLVGTNLIGADIAYTLLSQADLRRADLSNARLTGADLRAADLRGARLAGADLSYADLRGARLVGAVLSETRFDHAIWMDGQACQPGSVAQCLVREVR